MLPKVCPDLEEKRPGGVKPLDIRIVENKTFHLHDGNEILRPDN